MNWSALAALISAFNLFGLVVAIVKISFWAGGINARVENLEREFEAKPRHLAARAGNFGG